MELFRGWILNSIEEYEKKQNEIATRESIIIRYAGRVIDNKTIPDVVLSNGKLFIPDKEGIDVITRDDLKNQQE